MLHPAISKQLVGLVDCTYYNDENVLSSYKSVRCGSATCSSTALVFVVVYTLGIPLYILTTLKRYLSPSAKARHAASLVARHKARIGFVCGKYEPDYWYYELLEMTRKTGLMAVTSFLQTGSYAQLFAKLLISLGFFVVLCRRCPFNSKKLGLLVRTSQFCSLATIFFALMSKIGFFAEEGVSVSHMALMLAIIMMAPLFMSVAIIGSAIHDGVNCLRCCVSVRPRSGSFRAWAMLQGLRRPARPVRAAEHSEL